MRALIAAVKAALEAAGIRVYYINVPAEPQYPYVLLWSSAGRMRSVALCDERNALDDTLGATSVAITGDAVLILSAKARAVLDGLELGVLDGRSIDPLRLFDARPIDVDRDVRLVNGSSPMTGVDIYRISSTPA